MKRHASMNRIYRLVWSHTHNAWIPVAEIARGRGKGSRRKLLMAPLFLCAAAGHAEPTGGRITAGAGSISQAGDTTTIHQTSQNMSVNWQSFNIAPSETVNFQQPNTAAIAVNRIADTNGTQILGHLNANGQVYLINPNGILFGQGAQVNVGGLVASTLDVNDASLASNSRTFSGSGTGRVINQGTINAANGGSVALLGNSVSNQGTITAQLGTVALGAGNAVTLTFNGNNLVQMQVDQSVLNSLAENKQLIQADGGRVIMTAGARDTLLASVVNNEGVIEARTVDNRNGTITLLGGTANVGGTLDASAPNGGNGGFIETSAAHVKIADNAKITTKAANGLTGHWLIDPVDFTIAASGGDITGAALSTLLTSNSVTVQTATGTDTATNRYGLTGTNGDIFVNDVVSWSANTLTLHADRYININATLNGSGTARLALEYGQGGAALNNTATYNIGNGAKVNITSNGSFSTKLGSDGVVKTYYIIDNLSALQNPQIQSMTFSYVLGADIDASATSTWNSGAGFAPIGDATNDFVGSFDGLGHTISNLTVNRPGSLYQGLFGVIGSTGVVRNLGLVNASVTGSSSVGGLAGINRGTILNSYVTGSVTGGDFTGGLVGGNMGPLVGNVGVIANSYSTATVTGSAGALQVGGLVGNQAGSITNSYATGDVSGTDYVGGLVGNNNASSSVTNSYATGRVTTTGTHVGGLVAGNGGTVTGSFWNTETSGQSTSAGGTGKTSAEMMQASTFSGWDIATSGGSTAVWRIYEGQSAPLLRSFLTALTVTADSGSRVYDGTTDGLGVSYSVTPNANLLGTATTSVTSKNVGTGYTATASGHYSNQQGYDISYVNGSLDITRKALTITGSSAANKTYDGNATAAVTAGSLSGFVGTETVAITSSSGSFNTKDAGTGKTVTASHTLADGSNGGLASNYTATETLTADIAKKALTITGSSAANKTYDGNATAAVTAGSLSGFVGSETVTVGSSSGSFNTKDAGTGKTVTASHTLADGSNGGLATNYALANETLTADITPRTLTVGGITASNKMYDDTTSATVNVAGASYAGLVNGDAVAVSATGVFADKSVGTGKTVNLTSRYTGTDVGNYRIVDQATTTADITALPLTPTSTPAPAPEPVRNVTSLLTATLVSTTTSTLPVNPGQPSFNKEMSGSAQPVGKEPQGSGQDQGDKPARAASGNIRISLGDNGSTLEVVGGGVKLPGSE